MLLFAVSKHFVYKRRAGEAAVREIPKSAMAVSAGFGLLMLDQGRVRVQRNGVVLNESAPL